MKKRCFAWLICLACLLAALPGVAAQSPEQNLVILYTNDVHTNFDPDETASTLSYAHVAALKKELAQTNPVLLVDAGDHLQGTAYGAMDEGKTVTDLMNLAGYDAATLGNHEFDYGMTRTLEAVAAANFPYLSCNFMDLKADKQMLKGYKIFDMRGKKVAFVGITTPGSIASTAPAYFQDDKGNFVYDILGGKDGKLLYSAVQKAIDDAKADGADYVIGLGHLGVESTDIPWTSKDVIANTSGLNALIDGHSHTMLAGEQVPDKNGNNVLLTQTGSYFEAIGKMTISSEGEFATTLITEYAQKDAAVASKLNDWMTEVDQMLGEKIAVSSTDFLIGDDAGNRLVRITSTNLCDFNADAFYYAFNNEELGSCDVAIINGGGVRADAPAGDWSYKTMKSVNPFGNQLCLMEVTGQQLLDALEWGARATNGQAGGSEVGGFLHAAGLSYRVQADVVSSVQQENDIWTGGPTKGYRVCDVQIYDHAAKVYLPLDLHKTYRLAGANFTLRNSGDGFAMFDGAKLLKDYVMEDYLALVNYAKAFADTDDDGYGEITSQNSPLATLDGYLLDYENPLGSGRFGIATEKTEETPTPSPDTGDHAPVLPVCFAVLAIIAFGILTEKKRLTR